MPKSKNGKWITGVFILLCLAFSVFAYVMDRHVRSRLRETEERYTQFISHLPAMLADLNQLQKNPVFSNPTRKRNAEPHFSKSISYLGSNQNQMMTPSHVALRDLFRRFPNWRVNSRELKSLSIDPMLDKIDSSWMDGLAEYDHWDVRVRPDVQAKAKNAAREPSPRRIELLMSQIAPDFQELEEWAFAHAFKRNREGRLLDGLKTLRKTSALVQSSGLFAAQAAAINILGAEAVIAESLGVRGWSTIPKDDLKAYLRVVSSWAGFVTFSWLHELPEALEAYMEPRYGACAGADNHGYRLDDYAEFFAARAPFETDFSDGLKKARALQSRLSILCKTETYEMLLSNEDGASRNFPYLRRVTGMNLYNINLPNWSTRYEAPAKK